MKTSIAKHLLSVLVLAAAAGAAQAAVDTGRHGGARDPYTEGARSGARDPFTEGARSGQPDPYTEGARTIAGLDRSGVSAEPSRTADPYLDGARATDVFTDGALTAARG